VTREGHEGREGKMEGRGGRRQEGEEKGEGKGKSRLHGHF